MISKFRLQRSMNFIRSFADMVDVAVFTRGWKLRS